MNGVELWAAITRKPGHAALDQAKAENEMLRSIIRKICVAADYLEVDDGQVTIRDARMVELTPDEFKLLEKVTSCGPN